MSNTALSLIRNFHQKDIIWTDRYLGGTPFHPGYWVQTRLRNAIVEHSSLAHGILLDVGCGIKPYEATFAPHVERYIGLEYSPESGYLGNRADFCADAAALPLENESVDTILCTEVMEHVPNPDKTMSEFVRVLKPGGVVITTAPFVYPVHDEFDFFRYSPDGIKSLMERHGLHVEKVKPLSGGAVTLAILINLYVYYLCFTWTKWLYPIGLVLRPVLLLVCFFLNITGVLLDLIVPVKGLAFNHLTVAAKK